MKQNTSGLPHWYWHRGLHDARILTTEEIELPYDYTQRDPVRNCFRIHLDASQAMFDTTVKSISLFNYKILRDDTAGGLAGCYWKQDTLEFRNGKYRLELSVLGKSDLRFVIRFGHAEVCR